MPAPCPAAPKGHSGVRDQPRAPRHHRPSRAGPVPSELNGAFLQRAGRKACLTRRWEREKRGLELAPAPYKPLVLLGSVPRPCCRLGSPRTRGTGARVAAWVCWNCWKPIFGTPTTAPGFKRPSPSKREPRLAEENTHNKSKGKDTKKKDEDAGANPPPTRRWPRQEAKAAYGRGKKKSSSQASF